LIENSDFVNIGDHPVPIIAESPRQRVVLNNSDQIGLTKIVSNEGGKSSECPFRNIGIKLSADNLNLLRGQTTSLHIQVSGLSGITNEVPLTVVNNSPTVISISGGNNQLIKINPEMVNVDGTFNINQTLTGIVPGSFGITGTVTWSENCGNS
jgi:hypothetical protein